MVLTDLLSKNVLPPGVAAKVGVLKQALGVTKMCFVASTLVLCQVEGAPRLEPIGGLQSLAREHPELTVWARDEFSGEEGWKRPIAWFTTHPEELCHLSYDLDGDGVADETLSGTAPHPFWVVQQEEFVPMGDLKAGDVLTTAAGKTATVTANTRARAPPGETFTTYNFEVADFHTYFVGEVGVWVHNAGRTCEELFSLYTRFRSMNNKTPEEAWRLMMNMYGPGGPKAGQYSDVALGTAVEASLRTDVYGDELLKLWTKGPRESPGHNMYMHFKEHVLENKSGIPGGEFPNITNPIDYVKAARTFIQSAGDDVAVWTQEGKKLVLHKTDARFAVQEVATGEMRTFFRANPRNGTLLDWARQRGYSGPDF